MNRRLDASAAASSWLAPALAATLVLVIGLPLAALLNIWVDEAYTVHTTGAGIAYALHEARTFELQPPLYFLFLSVWRFANEASIAFARFPSLVFAAAAAALIVLTARRITSSISPTALAVATACNPTIIWAAVEMRVYALVLLIAAMLTFTYFAGFLAPEPSRPAQAVYVAAGIAGLYTQFYVGLVLAAFACVLLFVNRRQIVACILANVAIVVGFLPFVPVALQQFHASSGGDVQRISTLKAFHEIANANFIYLLPHELAWSGAVKTGGFLIAGCLVAAIVLMGRPRLGPSGRTLLLCWALASFFYAFTFAVTGEALDVRRHVIAVAPLALLAGYAVLSGLEKYRRSLLIATTLVYATFCAGSLWWAYRPPLSKTGDWKHVAARLSSDSATPVVVFPANLALPLARYMPPHAPLVPFPQPMAFSSDYLDALKLRGVAQVADTFTRDGLATRRIWIVTDNSCDPGPKPYEFACKYLQTYLSARYRLVESSKYHGAAVALYEPDPLRRRASAP